MQTLRIRNFQSIRNVAFNLGGFTTIEGDSRTGKSAIVRALRALVYNVRSTKPYVRHGATSFEVEAGCDGKVVRLQRGAKTNYYEIDDTRYEKMGTNVPEAVAEVTGFAIVEYDKDLSVPLQVQGQFEEPFLLGNRWPGTAVTKVLASVSRLNILYIAQKLAGKRQRQAQADIRVAQTRRDDLDVKLEGYVNVPAQVAALAVVSDRLKHAEALQGKLADLQRLRGNWQAAEERAAAIFIPTSRPEAASCWLPEIQRALTKVAQLRALARAWDNAATMLARVVLPESCPEAGQFAYNALAGQLERVWVLRALQKEHNSAIQRLVIARNAITAATERRTQAHEAKTEFLASLATCPFCGQVMPS